MATKTKEVKGNVEGLFQAGAHFGLIRSRRHPTSKPYIFGTKNKVEIFDLEKTAGKLEEAQSFAKDIVANGGQILFVGGKNEARDVVFRGAEAAGQPVVAGRWLGGTLTNFTEIKKRIARLADLTSQREKGELGKYTKKERLLIDREIKSLDGDFSGLSTMKTLPKALFVIDPKREHTAMLEAKNLRIPVIALASSDCDFRGIKCPIPGNDASVKSIEYVVNAIVSAVEEGKRMQKPEPKPEPQVV